MFEARNPEGILSSNIDLKLLVDAGVIVNEKENTNCIVTVDLVVGATVG